MVHAGSIEGGGDNKRASSALARYAPTRGISFHQDDGTGTDSPPDSPPGRMQGSLFYRLRRSGTFGDTTAATLSSPSTSAPSSGAREMKKTRAQTTSATGSSSATGRPGSPRTSARKTEKP